MVLANPIHEYFHTYVLNPWNALAQLGVCILCVQQKLPCSLTQGIAQRVSVSVCTKLPSYWRLLCACKRTLCKQAWRLGQYGLVCV